MFQFGSFELDERSGDLRKHGVLIRIQEQPLQILTLLLDHPGELVSREEIRRRLWAENTMVDFDNAISSAVRKIRAVLNDSSEAPRFVETVARKGYRFVAPVVRSDVLIPEPATAAMVKDAVGEPVVRPLVRGKSTPAIKSRLRRTGVVITVASVAGLLAGIDWTRSHLLARDPSFVRIQSLAVLPFKNMSGDPEQEYFADGMTQELITALARIGSVRLISRTSAMRYKHTEKSIPEITRELNVDAVVEGAVLRFGNRIRLSVQLVTPSPERDVWADVYEGDIQDISDLQRKAAHNLGNKIGAKATARPALTSGSDKHLEPETYENYLRARHFLAQRNAESMKKALGYFQTVLDRDPEYAPAYSGLAIAYDLLGSYAVLPPQKSFPNARSSASRALELDDALAEAYIARAVAASFGGFDWSAAERDFQRAIRLDPSSDAAHHWYAEHLISIAKADRAVGEMELARQLDPLSLPTNAALGRVYRDARRYGRALEQCRKTLDLHPNTAMAHWCFSQAYIGEHRYGAAIQELKLATTLGKTPLILRDLAWSYAAIGEKDKANAILEDLLRNAQSEYISPYSIGVVQAALGETDKAFQNLERALTERDSQITYLSLDPELDALRSDPRFQSLLERLHIPR